MVIRNDPVTVKHTKQIFTDVGKVMMAFILATDFDFIAYMSKMAFSLEAFFMPIAFLKYDPKIHEKNADLLCKRSRVPNFDRPNRPPHAVS